MPKAEEILKDLEEKRDSIRKARKVLSELKTDKEELEKETLDLEESTLIEEPAEFETCVKNGGRVRTKDMGDGKFMRICFLNGKSFK